jgi:HAD superfamily hydrolase (TIGR01450 family)
MPSLDHIAGFLLDMDGTLLIGGKPLPGAAEVLAAIRRRGAPLLVLTNNSSDRREAFHAKLENAGLKADLDEVFTSGDATCDHLLNETAHRRVFLLGTQALRSLFVESGIELAAVGEPADAVVVAFDLTLDYAGLRNACTLLLGGADYFATHPDATCITPDGLIPDVGAIIAAIETVTGRNPFVVGKPERPMVDAALGRLGTTAEQTLLVGDQLDTDMTMAARAGLFSVLTLTGETDAAQARAFDPAPSLIVAGVHELAALL